MKDVSLSPDHSSLQFTEQGAWQMLNYELLMLNGTAT